MALPPLYKYLDVRGAKLTLGNQCFRFAKPSEFQDGTDMTAEGLFPEELKKALATIPDSFVGAIMANLYAPPTCPAYLRPGVVKMQAVLRAHPEVAPAVKEGLRKDPEKAGLGLERWKERAGAFVKETNDLLQNYRVLCVTTDKASDRMWRDYRDIRQGTQCP
ncbi:MULTISPECIES: hypothetical protein [unclassified Bradyrhizobium]|uniref:hypothetical protein n=1 Tax=unclassified Bradyrhizobium TaxID=2631580 RepID=UPI0029170661|nr:MULTISPECIES: hypothetical protein [unclassified Bradyrhizobium]